LIRVPRKTSSATYDSLGRVLNTTHPDGSLSKTCYADWVTVEVDRRQHRTRHTRDAYGRTLKIEEYSGTFASCDGAVGTPYATTFYQYDVLGNLRFVTDAKNNQTEMRYDTLSRKTWMHDPDMGTWT
jgi:YD repeat-containing protein